MSETIPDRRDRTVPESLRLRSVTPSLTVDDLEASIGFYRDIVGFTVIDEWKDDGELRGVALVAGSARLLLGQDDGAKGWDRTKGEGYRLYLNTAQNVDQIAANIEARGGSLESQPEDMPWGSRAFTIRDPDGFTLTISSAD